jgi:hypothetical protein
MRKIGLLLLCAVIMTGCVTEPEPKKLVESVPPPPPPKTIFTPAMFDKIPENQRDKIQFYLSAQITLTESTPGAVNVDNKSGMIIITEDAIDRKIQIPAEAPGILTVPDMKKGVIVLTIGFDENNKRHELLFAENRQRERFELMIVIEDGLPKTTYGGAAYEIYYPGPGIPHLLVATEQRTAKHPNTNVVKGRYITDAKDNITDTPSGVKDPPKAPE